MTDPTSPTEPTRTGEPRGRPVHHADEAALLARYGKADARDERSAGSGASRSPQEVASPSPRPAKSDDHGKHSTSTRASANPGGPPDEAAPLPRAERADGRDGYFTRTRPPTAPDRSSPDKAAPLAEGEKPDEHPTTPTASATPHHSPPNETTSLPRPEKSDGRPEHLTPQEANETAHNRIRVLLADDEHLIRGALAALLALEDDLSVVGEAASGAEAVAMARARVPDVAVLDLQMPGLDGVKAAQEIGRLLPECRTMIVTSHGRPGHLKRALAAGARGFVPKTASAQQLAEIIRTVHAGTRYVDPDLAADAIAAGDSPLTAREAEVLELAADGAPVAEIAERASLTPGTVRNYLSSAAAKLGAENRHTAARMARERGWL